MIRYYLLLGVLWCYGCTPVNSVKINVISQPNTSKQIGCHIDFYQDPTVIKKTYDVIATIELRNLCESRCMNVPQSPGGGVFGGYSHDCNRQVGMKIIRDEACMVGGDAVILSQEKNPDAWSTCFRADVSIIAYKNKEDET